MLATRTHKLPVALAHTKATALRRFHVGFSQSRAFRLRVNAVAAPRELTSSSNHITPHLKPAARATQTPISSEASPASLKIIKNSVQSSALSPGDANLSARLDGATKPLLTMTAAVTLLLVGAVGTSVIAVLTSVGVSPSLPIMEPICAALEQHNVSPDTALHGAVATLVGLAGVLLAAGTAAVTRKIQQVADASTSWLQQQAAASAKALRRAMDQEVEQELAIIKSLQVELEAEARRLQRQVGEAEAMQARLRQKQEQLQSEERTRRNGVAARLSASLDDTRTQTQVREMQARLVLQSQKLTQADTQLVAAEEQLKMADEALAMLGGALKNEANARDCLGKEVQQLRRTLQAEVELRRETEAQVDVIWKELGTVLSWAQLLALQQRVAASVMEAMQPDEQAAQAGGTVGAGGRVGAKGPRRPGGVAAQLNGLQGVADVGGRAVRNGMEGKRMVHSAGAAGVGAATGAADAAAEDGVAGAGHVQLAVGVGQGILEFEQRGGGEAGQVDGEGPAAEVQLDTLGLKVEGRHTLVGSDHEELVISKLVQRGPAAERSAVQQA